MSDNNRTTTEVKNGIFGQISGDLGEFQVCKNGVLRIKRDVPKRKKKKSV